MIVTKHYGRSLMIRYNSLFDTLLHLKGNPKACIYTEPLWGIPYNLFAPFVSIYMFALGLSDRQIGLVASIGMAFQIIFALLSGVITDKLGRKRATLVFDIISWSVPCLIWAFSNSFLHFVIAAIVNSVLQVTANSWGCLLVEDSDKKQIVNVFAWVHMSSLVAAFFAPVTSLFIKRFELVPTIRVIYLISFVMMTTKFIVLNKFSNETAQGKIRMEETRSMNLLQQLSGYKGVVKQMLDTPETLLTLGILLIMSICNTVNNTFWSILVTQDIGIPAEGVGIFPFLRSLVILTSFFVLVPRIRALRFKRPLITGFSTFIMSQLLLISAPGKSYLILVISVFLEACSLSLISPLLDSMQVILVDPHERARIIAMMYVFVMALSSPFGWIAGVLSGMDHRLPFVMNIVLLSAGIVLTIFAARVAARKAQD